MVGGLLTSILTTTTKTQVQQTSQDKLSGELSFSMQTIQRLAQSASLIEMNAGTTSSTLKLRMQNLSQDPTLIYLSGGTIYIQQGTSTPQALTDSQVSVSSLQFQKFSQYPGKDVVQIDIAMNDPLQPNGLARSLRSAISRASAATFDSDLIPGADNSYSVGGGAGNRWKNAQFSGTVSIANQLGIGTLAPSYPLDIETANNGIFVSSTAITPSNFLLNLQAGTTTALYVRNDGNIGIGTDFSLNPLYYSSSTVTIMRDATTATSAQLELSPRGDVSTTTSSLSKLRFRSTFGNYSADQRPRVSAQIVSGFDNGTATATWGYEYLGFDVGKGFIGAANDSQTDPVEIFRATRTGITMGSLTGSTTPFRISNVASPATSTDVATKGYVDSAVGSAGNSAGTMLLWTTSTPPSGYTYTGIIQPAVVSTLATTLPSSAPRYSPATAVDSNGNLYVIGGNNGSGNTNTVFRYNSNSNWNTLATAPVTASAPMISALGDASGNIYLFSATNTKYWDDVNGVWVTSTNGGVVVSKFNGSSWSSAVATTTAMLPQDNKNVFALSSPKETVWGRIASATMTFIKKTFLTFTEKAFAMLPIGVDPIDPPDNPPSGSGDVGYSIDGFGTGLLFSDGTLRVPYSAHQNASPYSNAVGYVIYDPSSNTATSSRYAPYATSASINFQCLALRSDGLIYGPYSTPSTRYDSSTSGFYRFSSASTLLAVPSDAWNSDSFGPTWNLKWDAPCVWSNNQKAAYIFGGANTSSTNPYSSYTIYEYLANHHTLNNIQATLNQSRYAASAVNDPSTNYIYIVGGRAYNGSTTPTTLSSVEVMIPYYLMRKN
jgi:hypothetical protein